jgi:hypothetical protein
VACLRGGRGRRKRGDDPGPATPRLRPVRRVTGYGGVSLAVSTGHEAPPCTLLGVVGLASDVAGTRRAGWGRPLRPPHETVPEHPVGGRQSLMLFARTKKRFGSGRERLETATSGVLFVVSFFQVGAYSGFFFVLFFPLDLEVRVTSTFGLSTLFPTERSSRTGPDRVRRS